MSFFGSNNLPPSYTKREYLNRYNEEQQNRISKAPPTPIDNCRPQELPQRHQQQEVPAYRPQGPYIQPDQYARSQETQQQTERPPPSKLSNYGERSLVMDQRGVHDKQTSKFDIINMKPREHSQDIRQYPCGTRRGRST